jgi:hypothetical protein
MIALTLPAVHLACRDHFALANLIESSHSPTSADVSPAAIRSKTSRITAAFSGSISS